MTHGHGNDGTFFPRGPDDPPNAITFDELHALVLGLTGFWLGRGRHPRVAFALAVATIVGLQPPPLNLSHGWTTVTNEPWYFVTSLLASYLLGRYTDVDVDMVRG